MFDTSDLPGGVVNILTGSRDHLTKYLTEHQDVQVRNYWYLGTVQTFLLSRKLFDIIFLRQRNMKFLFDNVDWISCKTLTHNELRRLTWTVLCLDWFICSSKWQAMWYFGSAEGCKFVEHTSAENLKRTWVNYGVDRNWEDSLQSKGEEFLYHSVQVKNIWIPMGDIFANWTQTKCE